MTRHDAMKVLVVDDEPLLAIDLADCLEDAGFMVVGPAGSVKDALALIAAPGCDAAVIDVNLGRETAEPIAHELTRLGIPFIVVSGYAPDQIPLVFHTAPRLVKPFDVAAVVTLLRRDRPAGQ